MLSWYRGRLDDEWRDGLTIRPGERWRFTVRLKRPHGNANPHGFDYEAWLFERGLRATGYVRPRTVAKRLDDFVLQPAYVIERWRDRIRNSFFDVLADSPYVGVLVALAVGDQQAIPATQWRLFRLAGVTHLMSISGLHVTMVALLFAALVGWLWRRSESLMLFLPAPKAAITAGSIAALAYSLIAGFAVPTQRTLYMLAVVAVALWSGRNLGASRSLLLALLLVLLLDPWAVLVAGFLALLRGGRPALFRRYGAPRSCGLAGVLTLARWGTTQWAVTVGTLPLLLLWIFQQFSLVSPLANALAIPVVSFLITPLALLYRHRSLDAAAAARPLAVVRC
jgi:competence protein ComEC